MLGEIPTPPEARGESGEEALLHPDLKRIVEEGKATRFFLVTRGQTGEKYIADIVQEKVDSGDRFDVSGKAREMLRHKDFRPSKQSQNLDLIQLRISDLVGPNGDTSKDAIYKRASDLGLGVVPAEVGPEYRMSYKDQPAGHTVYIGMEPMTVHAGFPVVFSVVHQSEPTGGYFLSRELAGPKVEWDPSSKVIFRIGR